MESSKPEKKKYSSFLDKYYITESLGEGKSSKVYKAHEIDDPSQEVAVKLIKQDFIKSGREKSIQMIEHEIWILKSLNHKNINRIIGYGTDGVIIKPSGRKIENLVYLILEYVPCGLFFDLCESAGAMGEDAGRFFMDQIRDMLGYMRDKKVAHRDIKLENILVGDGL